MKIVLPIVVLFAFAAGIAGGRQETTDGSGVIYGVVFGKDGLPVRGIGLTASPLDIPLGTRLSQTRTNDAGEYRFEKLRLGKYTVFPDDEEAGYSIRSTGANNGDGHPSSIELTVQHPEGEFQVYLSPPAGFLRFHLTNRSTGNVIPGMFVHLMLPKRPKDAIQSISCPSDRAILIAPNKSFLLHVAANGFDEWPESAGNGKQIYLRSGETLTLEVALEPVASPRAH